MRKLLQRIPRWLTVTLASFAAAALLVFSTISKVLNGWPLVISLVLAAAFAALAIGLPQLQQWQAEQDARLQVTVEVKPPSLQVPPYGDTDGVIAEWLDDEESRSLASLRRAQQPARPRGPFIADLDALGHDENDPLAGFTVGDIERLEDRKAAGEELSEKEKQALVAARESTAHLLSTTFKRVALMRSIMSMPETRTPEEYEEEVREYRESCLRALDRRLLSEFVEEGYGRLEVTLHNLTDRPYENVQVEVYVPGKVRAIDPEALTEPPEMPQRPRPFGERQPPHSWLSRPYPAIRATDFTPPKIYGPHIDNSSSARITYDPVTLRPHAQVVLDCIHFLVYEDPGTVIDGSWGATATNADGCITGVFSVVVSDEPLPIRRLLDRQLRNDPG